MPESDHPGWVRAAFIGSEAPEDTCRTRLEQLPDKEFMVDGDNKWLVQGHKGQIIYAYLAGAPCDGGASNIQIR